MNPETQRTGALSPQPALFRIRATESKKVERPIARAWLILLLVALGGPMRAQSPVPLLPHSPPPQSPLGSGSTNQGLTVVAVSESFAMTFPGNDWFSALPSENPKFEGLDLAVYNRSGGAWVKARLARRSNRGVEGSLIDEASEAKYLIQYDPATVRTEISLENYSGSALYCGRLRQGSARKACSLVAVVLHGHKMIRLHSLIDAKTPRQREVLLSQVETAFASLERLGGLPAGEKAGPSR